MRPVLPLIPWLLLVSSCSTPPKPPTVDETLKRPANTAMAVELQVCKNDLHNIRILATESGRLAASTEATLQQLEVRQRALMALRATVPPIAASPAPSQTPSVPAGNSVFTVRFDFASTRMVVPGDTASALIDEARSAPLVLLRGRTDGSTDAPAESRIARERAAAVRDYLVAAGVDPARIRATYQPAGDHAADNTSPTGRSLNRRVEIEVYRARPVAVDIAATAMH